MEKKDAAVGCKAVGYVCDYKKCFIKLHFRGLAMLTHNVLSVLVGFKGYIWAKEVRARSVW